MKINRAIRRELDRWRSPAAPDWHDVLRRAGVERVAARGSRRRRHAVFLGLLGLALLAAGGLISLGGDRSWPHVVAHLRGGEAFAAQTPEAVLSPFHRGGRVFKLARPGRHKVSVNWTLSLSGMPKGPVIARLRRGASGPVLVRLCTRCGPGAAGTIRVPRRVASLISAGGAVVEVTSGRRVARGVARIALPPQRLRLARCLSRAGLAVRARTDGKVRLPTVLPAPRLIDRAIGRCRSLTRWPRGFGSARTVLRLKERAERYAACARRLGFELGAPRLFLFNLGMGFGFSRSSVGPAAACGNVLPLRPQVAKPKLHGANFWVKCRFSHFSNDDPIVYPGQPGRSHAHTFFGNRSTDAFSTPQSLRSAATTCTRSADRAAYWVPTLFLDGRPVRPASVGIYHLMKTAGVVRPFPPGLQMVAGDGRARRPQSVRVTHWTCWLHSGPFKTVPRCPEKGAGRHGLLSRVPPVLTLHVTFPNCWDGRRLDSPDHKSHMAYMVSTDYSRCPRSHPVQVPGITLLIAYPIAGGRGVELSSGGQFSAHADFINAWDQRILAAVVASCSRRGAKASCADEVERARP